MSDVIKYKGDLFQVIQRSKKCYVPLVEREQEIDLVYELVKRPPGVRAIVVKDGQVLLNKEYRYELDAWDFRLPGGKVFDSLDAFSQIEECKLMDLVKKKLVEELREEADIETREFTLFDYSQAGLTVEWDLYYFLVSDFELITFNTQKVERKGEWEFIQQCWLDYDTALQYCLQKKIMEERSVAVLLRFLLLEMSKGVESHVSES